MKTINFIVIILVAIMITACGPTKRDKRTIVNQYYQQTEFFEVKVIYQNYNLDSTTYYIAAKDIYEANRMFDQIFDKEILKSASFKKIEIDMQNYPY